MLTADFLMSKMEREYKGLFLDVVSHVKQEIDFNDIVQAIEDKNLNKLTKATKFDDFKNYLSQFKPLILNTINIAAENTEKKRKVILDLDREMVSKELKLIDKNFIDNITIQQKENIENILREGLDEQLSYKYIAKKIENNIGLNRVQVEALNKLEKNLISNNTSQNVITKILENKAKTMLKIRSENIALTESARAVSSGRYLMQQQMYEDGDISANTIQKWLTARDERQCHLCGSLNNVEAKMNENFIASNGFSARSPILHNRCRCIVIILI